MPTQRLPPIQRLLYTERVYPVSHIGSDSMAVSSKGVKIVVVGGGIAGLSAAARLHTQGIKDVTVLEAQDRLGGRIHTIQTGEGVLELGAQWIHGSKGNSVYKLAKKHNLISDQDQRSNAEGKDRSVEFCDSKFLTSAGEHVDLETVDQITSVFMDIYEAGDEFFSSDSDSESESEGDSESESESSDEEERKLQIHPREIFPYGQTPKSYGEFFDKCVEEYFKSCENDSSESLRLKKAFCEWEKQWQYADNACSSLSRVGLNAWGKYYDCEGEEHIEFKNGFQTLLDVFIKDIPPECVLLSRPVTAIHWQASMDGGIDKQTTPPREGTQMTDTNELTTKSVVECEDGSRFEADYVIVTPSLGFLKEKEASLFQPVLPESKRNALGNMEFGTMDKIFLEWETRFWDEDCTGFEFLWLEDVPVVIPSDKCDRKTENGKPWYHNFRGLETVHNQPNMLGGFISGENAIIQESLEDEEVMAVCVEILAFFTKMDIPRPKRIIRSAWYAHPYVRGSYSLITPDTPIKDPAILREPLPSRQHPVLLFAGEGYSKHHFTASHGALESGMAAADNILKHLKTKKK